MGSTWLSPSKINVFLEVLGRRADGYHELETVMLRTGFCDVLDVRESADSQIILRLSAESVPEAAAGFPLDQSNLICQVASTLRQVTGCTRGAQITVLKRIPAAAGLAGGSGNAATTLLALNHLWKTQLPLQALHEIAARHGSDINFLLSGARAAVCRGRGELISPFPLSRRWYFVAVRPAQGNLTADIFKRTQLGVPPVSSASIVDALQSGNETAFHHHCFNRLTDAAAATNPEMARMLIEFPRVFERPVWMSGSGSTCFLPARSHREARRLQCILRQLTRRPVWMLDV